MEDTSQCLSLALFKYVKHSKIKEILYRNEDSSVFTSHKYNSIHVKLKIWAHIHLHFKRQDWGILVPQARSSGLCTWQKALWRILGMSGSLVSVLAAHVSLLRSLTLKYTNCICVCRIFFSKGVCIENYIHINIQYFIASIYHSFTFTLVTQSLIISI